MFHTDAIDQESTCKTLAACLATIKQWSAANPSHFPVILRAEIKKMTAIEEVQDSTSTTVANILDLRLQFLSEVRSCDRKIAIAICMKVHRV